MSESKVVFKGKFEIDESKPLEYLNTPTAKAYEVAGESDFGHALFALVCDSTTPLRPEALDTMKGVLNDGMICLEDWGLAEWTDGARKPVLIYQKPGEPVLTEGQDKLPPLKEDQINAQALTPLLEALIEFHSRGIFHRALSPKNLFHHPQGEGFMLGDALSMPPGMRQPHWAETIENAMTDPAGRGVGCTQDDFYSLGATLAFLAIGYNPVQKVDKDKLILEKINEGSFETLSAKFAFTRRVHDLITGLLNDDQALRWVGEDVKVWMGGGAPTPRQTRQQRSASRPFPFGMEQHLSVRSLAFSMSRDWTNAIDVIGSKALDRWISRSIGDEQQAEEIQSAVGVSGITSGTTDAQKDFIVTKVLLVLDKLAPMIYRSMAATANGLGPLVATSLKDSERMNGVAQIINKKIVSLWTSTRVNPNSHDQDLAGTFEFLSQMQMKRGPGYGVERYLYELNPHLPCQSPIVAKYYVQTTKELLGAFDHIATQSNKPGVPMDRHIAAFIAAKHRNEIKDSDLMPLSLDGDKVAKNIAVTRLLAKTQMFTNTGPLQSLSKWIVELLDPAIKSYNNVKRRKVIAGLVENAANTGDLSKVLMQIDNEAERDRDHVEFENAVKDYTQTTRQIRHLEAQRENRRLIAQFKGEQVAVMVAAVIAAFLILMLLTSQIS